MWSTTKTDKQKGKKLSSNKKCPQRMFSKDSFLKYGWCRKLKFHYKYKQKSIMLW